MRLVLPPDRILLLLFLALLGAAAFSDARRFRIPNLIPLAIALLYPAHLWASRLGLDWSGALVAAALVFACGLVLFARGALGGGDVKLLGAAALWAGPPLLPALLVVMGLSGGVLAALAWTEGRVRRWLPPGVSETPRVPYGVAIAAGASYAGYRLLLA